MRVLLYTWSTCSFCTRAKALLERSGVEYAEHVLDGDRARVKELIEEVGKPTMPFVFVDGEPIGGVEELERLVERGELG